MSSVHPVTRTSQFVGLLLLGLVLALLLADSAHAASGWTVDPWVGCTGGTNSGSFDAAGDVFVPCGSPWGIREYDATGALVQTIPTSGQILDAVPSPDGAYVYGANGGAVQRWDRQPNGSYVHDALWHLQQHTIGSTAYDPEGEYLAVDGRGHIFLADGAWTVNNVQTVVEYSPAGAPITRFGIGTYVTPQGPSVPTWDLGKFYWMLTGVAVTPDGATVYTTEVGNNRVTVWARQSDGSYAAQRTIGATEATNADRAGACDYVGWQGQFAAPYGVSLDGAGNLYVVNTTCKQVIELDPSGAFTGAVDVRECLDYPRPHGFAVGRDGTVYVGEDAKIVHPTNGAPEAPFTDTDLEYNASCAGQAIIMPGVPGGPGGPALPADAVQAKHTGADTAPTTTAGTSAPNLAAIVPILAGTSPATLPMTPAFPRSTTLSAPNPVTAAPALHAAAVRRQILNIRRARATAATAKRRNGAIRALRGRHHR